MAKKLSDIEILKKYQEAQGFATDSAFANALGISRQNLFNWYSGAFAPSNELLQVWSLLYTILSPLWIAQMAIEILRNRGLEDKIKCTCTHGIDDSIIVENPFCPKHLNVEAIITQ